MTAQEQVARYPTRIDALYRADDTGRPRERRLAECEYQEEEEPQHTPRQPGKPEPNVPNRVRAGEGLEEDGHRGDSDEKAEPAKATPVGAVPPVPGHPEIRKGEQQS